MQRYNNSLSFKRSREVFDNFLRVIEENFISPSSLDSSGDDEILKEIAHCSGVYNSLILNKNTIHPYIIPYRSELLTVTADVR